MNQKLTIEELIDMHLMAAPDNSLSSIEQQIHISEWRRLFRELKRSLQGTCVSVEVSLDEKQQDNDLE